MTIDYADLAGAVAHTGMIVRGGFSPSSTDLPNDLPPIPELAGGREVRTVVIIGNAGRDVWPHFRAGETAGPNPLDRWTRQVLRPIADRFDATFVHPSDEPFQPFQRRAQLADDVWPSPIGLLVHPIFGLWHAYRGAFLLPDEVTGLPVVGDRTSPCLTCADQPCLTTCPVDAFSPGAYDSAACAAHVSSDDTPDCLHDGCAARCACPVGGAWRYDPDQMRFHMAAFVGMA